MPSVTRSPGRRGLVRRGSAHPLEVLAGVQPRPRRCRTSPGGPGARASRCSAPATSPIRPGTTTCARPCVPAEPGLFRLDPDARGGLTRRLPPRLADGATRAGPVHAQRRDLHDLQAGRPHPQGAPPDLPARLRRGGPVQHRAGPDRQPRLATAGRSSASTRATCWRSRWRPARTATWCRRTSGRRGSPRSAPSPASTRSPTATPTWPSTSSRWRPACRSDPAMNWRVSSLDRYRLVSNSDAHSPPALAREATAAHRRAGLLRGPRRAAHRRRAAPARSSSSPRRASTTPTGTAPAASTGRRSRPGRPAAAARSAASRSPSGCCSRVEELADRPDGLRAAPSAPQVTHLIQLHEILGEINGVGPKSKTVEGQLNHAGRRARPGAGRSCATSPLDEIGRAGGELLGEAHRPAAPRRGPPHRPATTASTA